MIVIIFKKSTDLILQNQKFDFAKLFYPTTKCHAPPHLARRLGRGPPPGGGGGGGGTRG